MSEEFKIEIVDPEKSFLSKDDVVEVVVPAFEGEMGILKNHISIISFESEESATLSITLSFDTNLKVCSTRGVPPKSMIFLFFMPLDPALAGIKPKIFNL